MDRTSSSSEFSGRFRPARRQRLLVGLGDARRELVVLAALDEHEEFATEVCVHAADLLARARGGDLDLALLSSDLPGLGGDEVAELVRSPVGARTALLTTDPTARSLGRVRGWRPSCRSRRPPTRSVPRSSGSRGRTDR